MVVIVVVVVVVVVIVVMCVRVSVPSQLQNSESDPVAISKPPMIALWECSTWPRATAAPRG